MTQGKHTPGPWVQSGDACIVGQDRKDVAYLTRNTMPNPELRANARLIAAAPNMLEALRVARAAIVSLEWVHFNKIAGPGDTFDAWLSDNEALSVIDAEIARATGEKP